MHDRPTNVVATSSNGPTHGLTSEARKRWFELSLVLLVAIGGPMLNSLYLLVNGPGPMSHTSDARWALSILQEITALLLLGYVLSRRGLSFSNLGFRWSLRDAGLGILVAGPSFAVYVIGSLVVQVVHYSVYGSLAKGPTPKDFYAPSLLAILLFLLNPFFEELIVRAYLMNEVLQLTGSSSLSVAISVAVQFSYHLYYGWAGAISVAFLFLAFALYYARSRRALPVIVAHSFFDIYMLLRLL